ncbi:hypothetical protein [Streptomyces clavifer]|uniref:hypothetical protein n=1 Tax=Streptomyces clavifer TaxID=68188 RepID=UPI00365E4E33
MSQNSSLPEPGGDDRRAGAERKPWWRTSTFKAALVIAMLPAMAALLVPVIENRLPKDAEAAPSSAASPTASSTQPAVDSGSEPIPPPTPSETGHQASSPPPRTNQEANAVRRKGEGITLKRDWGIDLDSRAGNFGNDFLVHGANVADHPGRTLLLAFLAK